MRLINGHTHSINWSLILFSGLFVSLFLNVFQPFGISNNNYSLSGILQISGYGIVTSLSLLCIEFASTKLKLVIDKYKLIWFTAALLLTSLLITFYYKLIFGASFHFYSTFFNFIINVALVGIFIIVGYNLYKERLKRKLLKHQKITITSKYKSDGVLQLNPDYIKLVEAAGNYITIHYLEEGNNTYKVLRNSMKNIEYMTRKYDFLIRCHQSYLINLNYISSKDIKSNSRKLILLGHDGEIPVSRSLYQKVKNKLDVIHH